MRNQTNTLRHRGRIAFPPMILALTFASFCPGAYGDDAAEAAKPSEPVIIKVDGVFESPAAVPIKVGTKEIKSLTIQRIVPHGTTVEKNQNLIWFETKEIDKQIADAELESRLAEVALRDAEFKFKQFQESQKLDRETAEQTRVRAREDYDYFVRVDREQQIKSTDFGLINVKASLENAEEELAQLEKMYQEDDLTEESEEIVLKRARQAVDQARFRLESSELQTKQTLEKAIPRSTADQESALARAELAYESAVGDLDFARSRREIEMTKERQKFKEQETKLNDLRAERKRMVITAPQAGFFVHGALTRGAISDKPSTVETGSIVTAEQVIGTVIPSKPLQLRLSVAEDQWRHIKVGNKAAVILSAYPDQPLEATVKSVDSFPYISKQFDCVLSVKLAKLADAVIPTMNARAEFTLETEAKTEEVKPESAPK
jgi:HlyD family secretion protein